MECKFVCPMHSKPKQLKHQILEQRKVYFRAKQGEFVAYAQKTPNSLKGFSKAFLKAR